MAGRKVARLCIFFLLGSILFPQSLINRFRVPLYFNLQSGLGYDSNYLKLSNLEQDKVSYYPALLGDSESVSSLILRNTFKVKYSPYLMEGHETRIQFKINYNKYFESANKSYSSFGVYFAQHLGKYEWVKLSYSFLPQYYLRDYRDRDDLIINANTDHYLTSCYFSQGSTTLKYSNWLFVKRTWLEGIINYKTQYYNPEFTEFDLNLFSVGVQFHSRYFRKYSLKLGGTHTVANNITFQKGLMSLKDLGAVDNIRGYGMMGGIDMKIDQKPGKAGFACFKHCYDAGVNFKATGDCLIIAPMFISEKKHIDEIIEKLRTGITNYTKSKKN